MMFLNLEAPIHQLMTWTWAHPCQALPSLPGMGPMHTAQMSLSAQGTAWPLPHPRQSLTGISRAFPAAQQKRNTPQQSLCPAVPRLCKVWSCVWGSAPPSSAPSARQSPRQLPRLLGGKRAGHIQLMISPNPPLLLQKETAEPQQLREAAADSISQSPPSKAEPLCKL